jgi:hypothetical protein
LDQFESALFVIERGLAAAVAGLGGDVMPHVHEVFRLAHPDERAGMVSPDHYAATLKMSAQWGTGQARAGRIDGGATSVERYAELSFELDRAGQSGVSQNTALEHWGLDSAAWLKAVTFWGDKLGEYPNVAEAYAAKLNALRANPPPAPHFPARATAPAAPAPAPPSAAGNDGGVKTLADWARLSAAVQTGMQRGQDFMAILAQANLDLTAYQNAAAYWNSKLTADPNLGTEFFEALNRYL